MGEQGFGAMEMLKVLVICCCPAGQESVAVMEKEKEPLAVGLPDMRPELEMESPGGREPAEREKEMGAAPPEVVNWKL